VLPDREGSNVVLDQHVAVEAAGQDLPERHIDPAHDRGLADDAALRVDVAGDGDPDGADAFGPHAEQVHEFGHGRLDGVDDDVELGGPERAPVAGEDARRQIGRDADDLVGVDLDADEDQRVEHDHERVRRPPWLPVALRLELVGDEAGPDERCDRLRDRRLREAREAGDVDATDRAPREDALEDLGRRRGGPPEQRDCGGCFVHSRDPLPFSE
jgi:hypothetical protein